MTWRSKMQLLCMSLPEYYILHILMICDSWMVILILIYLNQHRLKPAGNLLSWYETSYDRSSENSRVMLSIFEYFTFWSGNLSRLLSIENRAAFSLQDGSQPSDDLLFRQRWNRKLLLFLWKYSLLFYAETKVITDCHHFFRLWRVLTECNRNS